MQEKALVLLQEKELVVQDKEHVVQRICWSYVSRFETELTLDVSFYSAFFLTFEKRKQQRAKMNDLTPYVERRKVMVQYAYHYPI